MCFHDMREKDKIMEQQNNKKLVVAGRGEDNGGTFRISRAVKLQNIICKGGEWVSL